MTTSTTRPRVTCQVATDFAALPIDETQWDDATARLGGPVYMTLGWLSTWWEFYGKGLRLRLFVFRAGGEIVGLLPLYLEDFGWGPCRTRVARLVGASLPPKTFDPPVDEPWAQETFALLYERLFGAEGCDLLSLGPVAETWGPGRQLPSASETSPKLAEAPTFAVKDRQTIFELPATYDSYLQSLGAKERQNLLRRQRQVEKQHAVVCDAIRAPESVNDAFEEFAALHAEQWRAIGKGGHFEAWPQAGEYNRALTRRMAERGRTRFFRVLADGRPISSRYAFEWAGTLYCELPARVVGDPWDRLGIGGLAILKLYETCLAEGVRRFDTGLGEYDHKTRLGGLEVPVGVWRVVRSTGSSRLKVMGLLAVGRFMTLLFQKIWYRRIVPRLPSFIGRTQRQFWLRYAM